jgi:hypothetical protein
MDTYKGAYINKGQKECITEFIHIHKISTRLTLSPALLNLQMDPMIIYFRNNYAHLLIFSDNRENLNELPDVLIEFLTFERINFNPEKSKLILNFYISLLSELVLPDKKKEIIPVEVFNAKDVVIFRDILLRKKSLIKKWRVKKNSYENE